MLTKYIYITICILLLTTTTKATQIEDLLENSKKYQNINLDSAISFALEARELASNTNKKKEEIEAINLLSTAFAYKGSYKEFEEFNNHAIYLSSKNKMHADRIFALLSQANRYRELHRIKPTINKVKTATDEIFTLPKEQQIQFYPEMYEAVGLLLYFELKDSLVSLEYLHKAQTYYLNRGDTAKYNFLYLQLGEIFRLNGRSDKAISYYEKAKEVAIETQDSIILGIYYRLRSALYLDRNNIATALEYLREAEKIFLATNNVKQLSDLYSMFAFSYTFVEDYRKSLNFNLQSLDLRYKLGHKGLQASSLINISTSYKRLGRLDSAVLFARKAHTTCSQIGHNLYLAKSMNYLSSLYSKMNNAPMALKYLRSYLNLKDSIEQSRHALIEVLEEKIRYTRLESDQELKSQIKTLTEDKQFYKYVSITSIIISILLSIFIVFIIVNKKK